MSDQNRSNPVGLWPTTQAVVVLMLLGFFLWSLSPYLNPFLLYLALLTFLVPFRRMGEFPLMVGVVTVLLLLWLLSTTGSLLAPFLVAMGLAYLLDPAVDKLQARGMGRTLAIAVLMGPVLAALVVVAVFGLPALGTQIAGVIRDIPSLIERLASWALRMEQRLEALPWVGGVIGDAFRDVNADEIVAMLEARQAELAQSLWSGVLGVGRGLSSALTIVGYVVLTPVIAFYLLRDWDRIIARCNELIPRPRQPAVGEYFAELDDLLGRFLRGQITVALLMGVLTALGLWVWGFPYAFLIGASVAVFSVVPYLGLVLSLLPALIVALTSGSVGLSLLKVAVVFAVVQGLEGTVISPRIVGDSVGLHPVWILLAIAAGGFFFGFAGLLLAVPVAAGLKLLIVRMVERYKASAAYLGTEGA